MNVARRLPAMVVLVLSLLWLTGCQATTAAGRWQRITTEHFELTTDLAEEDADRASEMLEQTRTALLTAAWSKEAGTRATARASVVVLASELGFEHYAGRRYTGFFANVVRPTLFLSGPPERWEKRAYPQDDAPTSVFRHELVHRLAAGIYGRQPRWFAEGLAQFLETIVISEDQATATIGRPNMSAMRKYRSVRSIGVADALAWRSDAEMGETKVTGLYGLSWLMVHYLYNTEFELFSDFQRQLVKGVDPAVAWEKSFRGLRLDDLDKALYAYSRHGGFKELTVSLPPVHVVRQRTSFTAADVHAIHAQLAAVGGRAELKKEAREEIEKALALEPANVLALKLRMMLDPMPEDDLLRRLREQVSVRADDGEAWLFLGDVLGKANGMAREQAYRKAKSLLPRDARANNALAWALVTAGKAEEALPFATVAALLEPWDAAVLDTYAASLFGVGRCADALRVQTRAVDVIPEHASGSKLAKSLNATLDRYQKECGGEAK